MTDEKFAKEYVKQHYCEMCVMADDCKAVVLIALQYKPYLQDLK